MKTHQIHPVQRAANARNIRRRANLMWEFGDVWYPSDKVIGVRLKNGHRWFVNVETLSTKLDSDHAYRKSDAFAVMDDLEAAAKLEVMNG